MHQLESFDLRKDAFLKAYGEARERYQVDFMSQPVFVQQENGTWGLAITPIAVDLAAALTVSPFHV